jgi:hypothetical protein
MAFPAPVLPLLTTEARIKRGLRRHLRRLGFARTASGELAPPADSKDSLRALHSVQRNERLRRERRFVQDQWGRLCGYFADGNDVDPRRIQPRLELVQAKTWQARLFRLASLTWSVPVSQGYGRRIRFLVWDSNNDKLIGLIGLADPVFNLRVRDDFVGWTTEDRRARLVNVLDAYVLGAILPYSLLLGGKLIASLVCTADVRDIFARKYSRARGIISKKRKGAALVMVTTSSALGRSSIYNRLRLGSFRLFQSVGYTAGWGHFHIPAPLFQTMRAYLRERRHEYADNHKYGDGPNWRLRTIRACLSELGLNPNLLRHGVAREVFICELAVNARSFLSGAAVTPFFADLPTIEQVTAAASRRWIIPRSCRRPDFGAWRREELLRYLHTSCQRRRTLEEVTSVRRAHGTGQLQP